MTSQPWSVDRWGRLLAGLTVLTGTVLAVCHHPGWLAVLALIATNLIVTSFTHRCLVHSMLLRLGALEREDLFLPGGIPRARLRELDHQILAADLSPR